MYIIPEHSFIEVLPRKGIILGTEDMTLNRTDKTPCPQGAYMLVGEAGHTCYKFPQYTDCREMINAKRMKRDGQEELVGGGGWIEILDGQLGEAFWGGDIWVKMDPKEERDQPRG